MSLDNDKTDKSPIATLTKNLDKDLSISPVKSNPNEPVKTDDERAGLLVFCKKKIKKKRISLVFFK
jgi:hypothetical protein